MVSGTISLPCSGYFSPFPHGTGSLSVSQEYLALPDGPGGFRQDFTCPALLRIPLSIYKLTHTGLSPCFAPFSKGFRFICIPNIVVLQPRQCRNTGGLGCSPVARRYWGNHSFVFSSYRYLDVSVPCVSLPYGMVYLQYTGLSHSDICGSKVICTLPQLFAAYHVLHRL